MAKKEKIQLNRSDDMEAIDAELAAAMEALDSKNQEVAGLLATCDTIAPADAALDQTTVFAEVPDPDASKPQPQGENPEQN